MQGFYFDVNYSMVTYLYPVPKKIVVQRALANESFVFHPAG
jgi:hypothetical protein